MDSLILSSPSSPSCLPVGIPPQKNRGTAPPLLCRLSRWPRFPFPTPPTLRRASRSSGGFFDVPALKEQLADYEVRMAASDFWNDAQAAQKLIGEANAIRARLDPLKELGQKVADLRTLKELVLEDAGDAAIKEFEGEFAAVAK